MRNRPVYDVVALLTRWGVGAVFLTHGWQKIQAGVTATGHSFDAMGVPSATGAAIYSTFIELLGGAALILGLALPVIGTLLIIDMAAALAFANDGHVMFVVDGRAGGVELVLVLGLTTLVLTAGGAGRLTLDHWLFGRRTVSPPSPDRPAAGEHPPRLATEMTVGANRDVVVAGKKKDSGDTT